MCLRAQSIAPSWEPFRTRDRFDHFFLGIGVSIDNRPAIADFPTHNLTLEMLCPPDPFAAGF